MNNSQPHPGERLIRRREVLDRLGISHSELYRRIQKGSAPRPIKIGPQRVAWRSTEIDAYIAKLIAENSNNAA